jgi:RNA polymerase sigma factor (sigma-70 family)
MKQVLPVNSEEEIILALRSKDERVLKTVYRQHYPQIANMVINNGGSVQEAKDIYQETIIIFYEKLQDEAFELTCRINTFLYSVSKRLWLKQLQFKNRFTDKFHEAGEEVALDWKEVGSNEEQYQAMHHALESIGEPCRTILKDFYMQSSSMEEITEKFGYTNSDNAKTQKYKCLKRLKKIFFTLYNTNAQ